VRCSSQVEPLGHCSGAAVTNPSAASCDSNRRIVSPWGAQHRVAQPPIPEQRQHLGGTGVNPERRDGFDPQQAVACHRLDGLVAAYRRAAQDPVDRVVLQADHQPLGLATSLE
jgi:hypothetical protein